MRNNEKYIHILLFEEGSIEEEKHKEALETMGIYMLPYRKQEMGNSPELLDVCHIGSEVSAIGFEITENYDDKE